MQKKFFATIGLLFCCSLAGCKNRWGESGTLAQNSNNLSLRCIEADHGPEIHLSRNASQFSASYLIVTIAGSENVADFSNVGDFAPTDTLVPTRRIVGVNFEVPAMFTLNLTQETETSRWHGQLQIKVEDNPPRIIDVGCLDVP